jgi:hypothetical protein
LAETKRAYLFISKINTTGANVNFRYQPDGKHKYKTLIKGETDEEN